MPIVIVEEIIRDVMWNLPSFFWVKIDIAASVKFSLSLMWIIF
jgi:hypothetical protein